MRATSGGIWAGRAVAATVGIGVAGLTYAAGYEVRAFRLRRVEVPVLASGSLPLRVLHISDLHLTPGQRRKRAWVRNLAGLEPDLVINTGDNLAHPDAAPAVLESLGPLLDKPGAFVFGSNDYHGPQFKNPARYLTMGRQAPPTSPTDLPWRDLRAGFRTAGWQDLTNARASLVVDGRRIELVGVDDPHLDLDVMPPARPAGAGADLRLGVVHAPYLRALDAMVDDGSQLVLAGHTHGGQLCIPGYGALVTNCDLEPARVKGLSRHPAAGGKHAAWLHVSAGLGTSPYTPVRFACPPEATLLTLVAR